MQYADFAQPASPGRSSSGRGRKVIGIVAVAAAVIAGLALIRATDARNDARTAAAQPAAQPLAADPLQSYANAAPQNAAAIAAAHKAFPAELPAVASGPVAQVRITLKDRVVQIAPGVKYEAWGFDGQAPGPVIHVRQGQRVHVTLTNAGMMPHSIDFHAARIAPNLAFSDVMPGKSKSFTFTASDPGVFMYHCGTTPVLAHIANGMYGAIVVDPATPLPHADRSYVLVASEWYLNSSGLDTPAVLSMQKAQAVRPDWVTWNGYAGQYVTHPLEAMPGETVRFYVVDAGPSMNTAFHVVGTLLDRAWVNGDMTQYERNVQTALVPAGGGGVFDVKIDRPGLYPFVNHSFASADMGQTGVLRVGHVAGTMSH